MSYLIVLREGHSNVDHFGREAIRYTGTDKDDLPKVFATRTEAEKAIAEGRQRCGNPLAQRPRIDVVIAYSINVSVQDGERCLGRAELFASRDNYLRGFGGSGEMRSVEIGPHLLEGSWSGNALQNTQVTIDPQHPLAKVVISRSTLNSRYR